MIRLDALINSALFATVSIEEKRELYISRLNLLIVRDLVNISSVKAVIYSFFLY